MPYELDEKTEAVMLKSMVCPRKGQAGANSILDKGRIKFMKYSKCKKDFAGGVKAAYRLGLSVGREDQGRFLQKAVNCIQATFGHLFYEIRRCDRENPLDLDPNYVHIKIAKNTLKKHITKMKKSDRNLAAFYQGKLKEHEKKINCVNNLIVEGLKLSKSE